MHVAHLGEKQVLALHHAVDYISKGGGRLWRGGFLRGRRSLSGGRQNPSRYQ
jgi:hypothetical protein